MSARITVVDEIAAWYRDKSGKGDQFQGLSVLTHELEIGKLIRSTQSTRLLDYGSGLGLQYKREGLHKRWGVPMPHCYDPGVEGRGQKPAGTFHGVICSDVLEHVPPEMVDAVIAELFEYSERFLWASVCCRPAKKWFDPDQKTMNLHLTIQPPKWWRARFLAAANGKRFHLVFTP